MPGKLLARLGAFMAMIIASLVSVLGRVRLGRLVPDFASVFEREMLGRRDRLVSGRHEALRREVNVAYVTHRQLQDLLRSDPNAATWITNEPADAIKRLHAAVSELRAFLDGLTPEQCLSIAREASDTYSGELDVDEIVRFLEQEKVAARAAIEEDIVAHDSRYQACLGRLYMASCQRSENPLQSP